MDNLDEMERMDITFRVSRKNKNLYIRANAAMQQYLDDARNWDEWETDNFMRDILDPYLENTRFSWVRPEEIGVLTDAPILGTYNGRGQVTNAWGFMNYQITSIQEQLAKWGEAILQRG